ncbi:MAG TPA: OB-fold nucleic acid binding domain-containing protein, partial [Acidimicrobiia bacterium]
FTLSQAGMAKHHITHKEPSWRFGLFVNGMGAILSAVVDVIIAITKFTHGAWVIVVLVPVMVVFLVRLARQYETEADQLECEVPAAASARILSRHVVLVFVDRLDLAATRAIQYARTLTPDDLRAVHFVVDPAQAHELAGNWRRLGMGRVALELVECPDRRLTRSAVKTVAEALAGGETEVSVLLPDRKYHGGFWHRILHDQTADALIREVSRLPHANVTTVPFHLASARAAEGRIGLSKVAEVGQPHSPRPGNGSAGLRPPATEPRPPDIGEESSNGEASRPMPIGRARWRRRVRVVGQVRSVRVQPRAGVPTLECVLFDDSGGISVVFLGRRDVAGIGVGTRILVEGVVGEFHGRLAILNPIYELLGS